MEAHVAVQRDIDSLLADCNCINGHIVATKNILDVPVLLRWSLEGLPTDNHT